MRIVLKTTGGAEHVLCDGHVLGVGRSVGPLDGMAVSSLMQVQPIQRIRATHAKPTARGNIATQVQFSVLRELASGQAAELFCFTHGRDVGRTGTLYIIGEGSGGSRRQLVLADAQLSDPRCTLRGCAVEIAYQVQGGAIT
jgi:hypothetical protein